MKVLTTNQIAQVVKVPVEVVEQVKKEVFN
jgi:hypothetical protein